MKRIFQVFVAFSLVLIFSQSSTNAQQLKIGIFDLQQIMRESKVVRGYRDTIEQEINTKKGQVTQKQEWIKSIEDKLRKDNKNISPADKRALSDKLETETRDLRRMREDAELEFQRMNRELTNRTMREIAVTVNNLAKAEGYSLIFERSSAGIAYMEGAFDITAKIVANYDANVKATKENSDKN